MDVRGRLGKVGRSDIGSRRARREGRSGQPQPRLKADELMPPDVVMDTAGLDGPGAEAEEKRRKPIVSVHGRDVDESEIKDKAA